MKQESPGLAGSWTHSFEEDEGGVLLFRSTHSFPFPASRRGRETLDFGAAGEVLSGMPGPDDRRRLSSSSLTSLGMNRFQLGAEGQVIEIVEARPDMLKLRYV